MAFATSKIIACVCAFCAAEMAGELFRNLSEKLPVDGACPRFWCRAGFHRKMKLIQRRAYGFRNFENYRLRVRVLCCRDGWGIVQKPVGKTVR